MKVSITKQALNLACNEFKNGCAIPNTNLSIKDRSELFKCNFEPIQLYVSLDKKSNN